MAVLLSPRPAVVAAARRAGAHALVVAPGPPGPSVREGAERPVRADWRDHRRLVAALAGVPAVRRGEAAVFGFAADSALPAARANEELGLPGTPAAAVAALMDKAALRARVNAAFGRPVSFARCGRAALIPFLAGLIGFPCVVKPRAGADGEGVRLLLDAHQAEQAVHDYPEITDLLVEELLEGPEITVETLSRGGRHRILGLTRLQAAAGPGLAVAGHTVPVPLDARTADGVRALVRRVLNLAGHRDGPAHTEIVLTARGPRLIEAHARPPGPELAQLLRLGLGSDVLACTLAAGLGLPAPVRPPRAAHAGLRFLDFPPGPLDLSGSLPAARALPGVVRIRVDVPPGGTVRHAPTGSFHHGHVLATGRTAAAVAHSLDEAAALLAPEPGGRPAQPPGPATGRPVPGSPPQ
ncbi:ATP-grasp domain-containing protein [Streptomyces bambusae]|uniref:ATP-grasp domain-containing protein n=1 Tax=Streptomyces bambusae TaxID=1550616 RepID=UPI001CFEA058|nr:ATP-grasp domain-containing protein [Streptomyces bambusae]MCB5168638.1 ATP-grasp domain-containing protein [Streptomyces bambusae]